MITSTERDAHTITAVERLLNQHGAIITSAKTDDGQYVVRISVPRNNATAPQDARGTGMTYPEAFNRAHGKLRL